MNVTRIIESCLYVDDLEVAEEFYVRVLGLEVHARVPGRHVFFTVGQGMFLVFRAETSKVDSGTGIPAHGTQGPGHIAFAMSENDIDGWQEKLAEARVGVESDFTWPSGGRSLYFRDPAGNSIELTTPRTWHMPE